MKEGTEDRGSLRSVGVPIAVAMLILAGAVAYAALAVAPPVVHACSCEEPSPLSEYAHEVVLAFHGNQVERIKGQRHAILVFEVQRVFYGRTPPRIEIRTNLHEESCGLHFGDGVSGVMGGVKYRSGYFGLSRGICGSPALYNEIEEFYGEPYPPDRSRELRTEAEALYQQAKGLHQQAETLSLEMDALALAAENSVREAKVLAEDAGTAAAQAEVAATQAEVLAQDEETGSRHQPSTTTPRILLALGMLVIIAGVGLVLRGTRQRSSRTHT